MQEFWLRTGFAVFGAIIGALGLNLLVGTTGQLSLAPRLLPRRRRGDLHLRLGRPGGTANAYGGLGLAAARWAWSWAWSPPASPGSLFSPIAARLRGIYLGIASLGLVFIGDHVLNTWSWVTGGFNGRLVPYFSLFGFSFGGTDSPYLEVLGVPFGQAERLWYLGLVLCIGACLVRREPRALATGSRAADPARQRGGGVGDGRRRPRLQGQGVPGLLDVRRPGGVLYALSIGSVAPDSFGLALSVQFLAMIVLGGLGSVTGSILGAIFVSALPLVFQEYAGSLPFIVDPGRARHRGEPGGGLPVRRWRSSSSCASSPAASPASRAACGAPSVHPVLPPRTPRVPSRTRSPRRHKPIRQPKVDN